jgi:hypothetical protein
VRLKAIDRSDCRQRANQGAAPHDGAGWPTTSQNAKGTTSVHQWFRCFGLAIGI